MRANWEYRSYNIIFNPCTTNSITEYVYSVHIDTNYYDIHVLHGSFEEVIQNQQQLVRHDINHYKRTVYCLQLSTT